MQSGGVLKFVADTDNCAEAGRQGLQFGGRLDANLETSIQLTIPPSTYHLCYGETAQGYDKKDKRNHGKNAQKCDVC